MSRVAVAGLCLIAATAVSSIGYWLDSRAASATWALGACIAFAGAAVAYRAAVGRGRRALPAAALALIGLVASTWIVETTLSLALRRNLGGPAGHRVTVVAVVSSGIGLALLAAAVWQADLIRPAVGGVVATTALLGTLTADPALPYLLAAAPLGIALLVAQKRRPRLETGVSRSAAAPVTSPERAATTV